MVKEGEGPFLLAKVWTSHLFLLQVERSNFSVGMRRGSGDDARIIVAWLQHAIAGTRSVVIPIQEDARPLQWENTINLLLYFVEDGEISLKTLRFFADCLWPCGCV